MSRLLSFLLGLFIVVYSGTQAAAADPAAAKAEAKELLEKAWAKTAAARAIANQCDLKSTTLQGNYQVAMAHWLVHMHQGSSDKALESLDTFFMCNPPAASAALGLRAKAWIQITKKAYSEALKTADGLAQAVVAPSTASSTAVPPYHEDAIEFLGHVAAFLEGPAEKNVDDKVLAKFEATVLARFDEPRKALYQKAKAAVAAEFAQYLKNIDAAKDESQASAAAAKKSKEEEAAAAGNNIAKAADKNADEHRQLREEFTKRMDALNRAGLPLQARWNNLQPQLVSANNTVSQSQTTAQNIDLQLRGEKDATRRLQLQRNLLQAQNNLDTAQRSLNTIQTQIQQTEAEFSVLQARKAELVRDAQAKGFQLANEDQALDLAKSKNDAKAKRVAKAKSGPNPKVAALETEASAFRTYDTFPLEDSRERLLSAVQ